MTDAPRVALVHGLWMGRTAMQPLARGLRSAGFVPVDFTYATLNDTPEHAAAALAARLQDEGIEQVLGHSLGGLVALRALELLTGESRGRLVLLGCPLQGSRVARRLAEWPFGARLLGAASETLGHPGPFHTGAWQVGQLAGARRFGLGLLAGGWERPGDGAVAISETRADFLVDHQILPVSHSGMLLSRRVARAAAGFLRDGRFPA